MVSHAWTIPKAHKKKRRRKRCSSPGPGTYKDVDVNLVKVAPPEWTIKGKYPWKVQCLDDPGPGTYSVNWERPGSSYSIQGKRKEYYIKNEPGPGSYSLQQSYDNIGGYIGKKLKKKKKESSPGPSEYFPSAFKSHDGWTFGTKASENFQIYDSPGPGSYESYRRSMFSLGKFGKETRGKLCTSYDSPGPGSYSPKLSSRDGWTIQGKRKLKYDLDDGPGPGEYFPFFNDGAPAYSIVGKSLKKKKITDEPGPDTYFPSIHPTKPRPRSARFTSGRRNLIDYDQPGPGQYNIGTMLGGPHTTLKGRPRTAERRNDYPGPGEYKDKYKLTKPRAASAKIGRARRMGPRFDDDTPGPGFYNQWNQRNLRGATFGSSTRPGTTKTRDGPGPGSYNIRSTFGDKPGKTMGGKRRHRSIDDDTPGPGMYNPRLGGGIAYSCQGKNSLDYNLRENLKKPGPGQYFPSYDPVRPHYPGKSMGSKRRAKYDDEIPGPGSYNQYKWDKNGKGWTIGIRPNTAGQDRTPGPAAYFPHLAKDAPAYTIGGLHTKPYDEQNPGPGNYDLKSDWNRGVLMGKEKRLKMSEGSNNPGPATYYLPENKGKGVHMGEKFYNKEFINTPGPGTYEQNGKKGGPHYSMAGVGVEGKYETVGPGPGAYNYVNSYKQVHNSKPGKSFGQKTGYKSKEVGGPGPGTYYLPKWKGKGITMKGRYPENVDNRSPGPAAYNQKWKTIQNLVEAHKSGSGGTMSKSIDFYQAGKIPGPGAYYSPSKLTNAGVKFGREIRDSEKKSENPGPGYYYIPCTVADVPKYIYPDPDQRYKWV